METKGGPVDSLWRPVKSLETLERPFGDSGELLGRLLGDPKVSWGELGEAWGNLRITWRDHREI